MPKIADIFRRHGDAYLTRFGATMPLWHRRALDAVRNCRTPAMGGHLRACLDCGSREYVYHSCRSRACPSCHGEQTADWLEARRTELLPTRYFHLVFTVPAALREPLRRNQTALGGALLRAAAQALLDLAADPQWLGATPAVLSVLHTWGRTLSWHPHVHLLVSAGGVTPDRQWREAPNPVFLVPVHALAKRFRGRFAALARAAKPAADLPDDVFDPTQRWVVYAKPCFTGPQQVLDYFGRYLHRLPISDSRILQHTAETVSYACRDATTGRVRHQTVTPPEFLRRCLQHVPPPGFHRIRYCGLWSPARRGDLRNLLVLLASRRPVATALAVALPREIMPERCPLRVCRCCGSSRLAVILYFGPRERAPP